MQVFVPFLNPFRCAGVLDSRRFNKQNIELNKRIAVLDKRIEEFNKSRHWWERKLKL